MWHHKLNYQSISAFQFLQVLKQFCLVTALSFIDHQLRQTDRLRALVIALPRCWPIYIHYIGHLLAKEPMAAYKALLGQLAIA